MEHTAAGSRCFGCSGTMEEGKLLMNQRQLFHAIEKTASKNYRNDEELLLSVVHEIIGSDEMRIKGEEFGDSFRGKMLMRL